MFPEKKSGVDLVNDTETPNSLCDTRVKDIACNED